MRSRLGYRIAYGEAAGLFEISAFDHGRGRDFAAGVGGEVDEIEKEVVRRLAPSVQPPDHQAGGPFLGCRRVASKPRR